MLVGEAEFGEDEFYLCPSFPVKSSVDELKLSVGQHVALLLLLVLYSPQQFLDD